MPRTETTVYCPSCGAGKKTKAQRNVKLVCIHCGEPFRSPATTQPPAGGANAAAAGEPAPADAIDSHGPSAGATSPGGVTVAHATPTVASSARPRARENPQRDVLLQQGSRGSEAPAVEPAPAPRIPREPVDPETLKPAGSDKAKAAGRRGGLARYRDLH